MNPIQSEFHNVKIDLRPLQFYPGDTRAQTISFSDGTILPVMYEGFLPYLPIHRTTKEEVDNLPRLELSSKLKWDPYKHGGFSKVSTSFLQEMDVLVNLVHTYNRVASELMSTHLSSILTIVSMVTLAPDNNK